MRQLASSRMAELRWWVCAGCRRPLDRHSSRTVPNRGGREYVCSRTDSGRFEPETGHDFDPETGLREKAARQLASSPAAPLARQLASSPAPPARHPRTVRYQDVHWRTHACELFGEIEGETCPHGAELLVLAPGSMESGTPACLVCLEAWVERREALAQGAQLPLAPPWS